MCAHIFCEMHVKHGYSTKYNVHRVYSSCEYKENSLLKILSATLECKNILTHTISIWKYFNGECFLNYGIYLAPSYKFVNTLR